MPYRFGDFTFDPDRGLTCRGEVVFLEPRTADLLAYLLDNPGRIISREELCEKLWDGKIASDAAISTQIRGVRKALGDDREHQKFVRTHPRRGFSFIAPVEQEFSEEIETVSSAAAPAEHAMPPPQPSTNTKPRHFRAIYTLGAVGLAAVIVIGLLVGARDVFDGRTKGRDLAIAVLPFDNVSGDASRDYISDAFTEDLITDLSRIRDAFVISRSTSFTYRGQNIDATSVAKQLGVRYVLEGTLGINGERVRINARLVDAESSSYVWSDRYELPLGELFDVKENVTGRIASVLRAELRRADDARQEPELAEDAWDYALRGNVLLYNHQSVTDYQEAHALLSKAVELDPGISSAWGGLAFVHFVASSAPIPGITRPDSARISLDAAQRATRADPMNAEPYWLVGAGYARIGQPERGMEACETAIELNPNMDCGHVCAGLVHLGLGEPAEAVPYFETALALNPRFRTFTKEKYLGLAYIQQGKDGLAIAALNRALSKAPEDGFANLALAAALALDGREDAARVALSRHLDLSDHKPPTLASLRERLEWLGPGIERMLSGLRTAGLEES
ncbi:hypothetical protein DDZ14_03940 [Maritimibacter sp. 55A14]|uniref:winged helix-turn-helix domain-containing tetratricopeptide repeat protein n=1 Tax=Maritimibacter sp. 55A14 TaxID=2174844 RepID=UPI000D6046DE|nr:winged helix-turn-helix domain-containing protein [Maritimibacter sp. 55A14]PWE33821.1 hypothetical protein DDZ14_03940 [Maritimibacter sp. 55A14]